MRSVLNKVNFACLRLSSFGKEIKLSNIRQTCSATTSADTKNLLIEVIGLIKYLHIEQLSNISKVMQEDPSINIKALIKNALRESAGS